MGKGILRCWALAAKDHRKAMLFRSVLFAAAGIFKLVSIYTHQSGAMAFALAIPMFGFSGYFYYRSRRPVCADWIFQVSPPQARIGSKSATDQVRYHLIVEHSPPK